MEISFDARKLVGEINNLVDIQLPRASFMALNKALFETRGRLQQEAKKTFKSTVPFTINSFLYEKPQRDGDNLFARVFIRDDAPKAMPLVAI